MRIFRLLAVCGILFALVASAASAMAQASAPIKTIDVRVGPYPMRVSYYSEAQGGKPLLFGIAPQEALGSPLEYRVTAVPGTTVNAVPVKAQPAGDTDRPTRERCSKAIHHPTRPADQVENEIHLIRITVSAGRQSRPAQAYLPCLSLLVPENVVRRVHVGRLHLTLQLR